MTHPLFRPERLDIRAFAQDGAKLSGQVLLSNMERLTQDLYGLEADLPEKNAPTAMLWQASGSASPTRGGSTESWLDLQLDAHVPLQCQRCLMAVQVPIHVERRFRFVKNEDEALAQDDDAEEELLVMSKQFDLLALVEDELIMALPMVPLHNECPIPVQLASSAQDYEEALAEKPKAFAALGALQALRK